MNSGSNKQLAIRSISQRIQLIQFGVLAVFSIILLRLFYWQIIQGDSLQAVAELQYSLTKKSHGSRGKILTADGYALATNQDVYTLFAEPKKLSQSASEISDILAPLLTQVTFAEESTDEASIKRIEQEWKNTVEKKLSGERTWITLKKKIPKAMKEEIEFMNLAGLGFNREEIRFYPEASMAAQILGFVGNNAKGEEQGYFGIEGFFDKELRGKSGLIKQEKDAQGLPIAIGGFELIQPRDGRDMTLTIRRDLQYMLEEKLKTGMERYGSKTAEAVIMDPRTGNILALAAFPSFDPLFYYQYDPNLYKQPLVSDLYEPGSTLKILTISAGIDAGVITPETRCDQCFGPRVISGYTIRTWNGEYHQDITMTQGLVYSDNTAMIFAAEKIEAEKFVSYFTTFGLADKTGIELQGEDVAPFREKWKELDIATASFGQGIAVNGLQMLEIAQIIANDGVMVKPRIVESVTEQNGLTIKTPIKTGETVISKKTADTVTTMMEESAQYGEAKWAAPKEYRIAGKTGTAQIPVEGHYDSEKTVASFIGFAPADNPVFVMLVKLREPSSSPWGSETAAPLWFSIARDLFIRMNVSPSH